MTPEITISDDLKSQISKCKPGETKTITITYTMGKDGKTELKSAGGETPASETPAPAKKEPKKASRPKAVMDAISEMY